MQGPGLNDDGFGLVTWGGAGGGGVAGGGAWPRLNQPGVRGGGEGLDARDVHVVFRILIGVPLRACPFRR